jgi:hypothetical protein
MAAQRLSLACDAGLDEETPDAAGLDDIPLPGKPDARARESIVIGHFGTTGSKGRIQIERNCTGLPWSCS